MVVDLVQEGHVHLSLVEPKQQKHHVGANVRVDVVTKKVHQPVFKLRVWTELPMLQVVEEFLRKLHIELQFSKTLLFLLI